MNGGPWHCGFPMMPGAGNQAAGSDSWIAWRCENCAHQEVVWGQVIVGKDGVEKFVAQPRKVLTVLMCKTPNGVLCRGICQDTDIFNNLLYVNEDHAVKQIGQHYSNRGFRCVFNLPKESTS